MIRNTNLINPAAKFGNFGGDLWFKAKSVFFDRDVLNDVPPKDLETGFHVGEVEIG
jgi:hypothetical protein